MARFSIGRQSLVQCSIAAAVALAAGQVLAAGSLTVFESRMPDGSVILGDSPAAGAKSVKSRKYDLPSAQSSRSAADAEREYWRQQAEGFERRQRAEDAARMRGWSYSDQGTGAVDQVAGLDGQWTDGHSQQPVVVLGGHPNRPLVPSRLVPSTYTSSPGAVNGRGAGFIGSGFSTAR